MGVVNTRSFSHNPNPTPERRVRETFVSTGCQVKRGSDWSIGVNSKIPMKESTCPKDGRSNLESTVGMRSVIEKDNKTQNPENMWNQAYLP